MNFAMSCAPSDPPGWDDSRVVRAKARVDVVVVERDPRAMNHMSPDIRPVHIRLEAWGRWAKDHGIHAWPKTTLLGRVIEQGTAGAAQQGRPPVSMPDQISAIDRAIARLGDIDRRTIQAYYLHWEPIEISARRMNMRVRQFQSVLRRARWRIDGYLRAIESA